MKKVWVYGLAWGAATLLALTLAVVTPNETNVMGRLPSLVANRLGHKQEPVSLPEGLPAGRTLALVAFRHNQNAELESWINGLQLRKDSSIAWVRMPVINDTGDPAHRSAVETRLLSRYPSESERASLLPVFTDRDAFVRATGITGTDQAVVLVLDRNGEVLARAQGKFDPDKAQALLETLRSSAP
ncbi:hypothetical protein [Polaromonas sp. C04]|uniref:hypothetical protein n=1 Tax=Polaromonas sp. C04 TaxID=1945857 RepID=UPI000987A94F|nr:hypothetical protein [Polaromonas sp. C04]OOG53438.1 hypothetical protein B0E49_10400 [Polaromonas sp. C04]